jgi:hypothetical protein
MGTNESFDDFLSRAWSGHADDAPGWAHRLQHETPDPQTPAQLQALARFTAHVLGNHLGRFDDARWRLRALMSHPKADASVQLAVRLLVAAISLAEHGSAAIAVFEPADQVQALAQGADMAAGQRKLPRALALLAQARSLLSQQGVPNAAARPLAVACNNIAWELHDGGAQRSPEETIAMLDIAAASKTHWTQAGTWLEIQRADYALSRMNAAAAHADEAAIHAQACLQACERHGAPAFELFFAHEACARAASAQHKAASLQAHVLHAQNAFNQLDTQHQAACRSALAGLRAVAAA